MVYLLECLQKTAPPVLIFVESKQEADDIHEYLILKGVEAVAICLAILIYGFLAGGRC